MIVTRLCDVDMDRAEDSEKAAQFGPSAAEKRCGSGQGTRGERESSGKPALITRLKCRKRRGKVQRCICDCE